MKIDRVKANDKLIGIMIDGDGLLGSLKAAATKLRRHMNASENVKPEQN